MSQDNNYLNRHNIFMKAELVSYRKLNTDEMGLREGDMLSVVLAPDNQQTLVELGNPNENPVKLYGPLNHEIEIGWDEVVFVAPTPENFST